MNVSDNVELSHCWFSNNASDVNSSVIDLSSVSDHSNCYNVTNITLGRANDIRFRGYVNDTSNTLADILNREDLYGEDFILGGENVRFKDYLDLISKIERNKKARKFPYAIAWVYALLLEVKARFNKKTPFLTRPTLRAIKYNRSYSSKKAIDKFCYKITPLREGLEETIKWYKEYSEERKK